MAVAFEEYAGSPTYGGSGTELSAVRRGVIAWSDINAFYAELFPTASAGNIPLLPAKMPGSNYLYADHVEFKPLFDEATIVRSGPPNEYDWADVTIQYRSIPYSQENDGEQPTGPIITRRTSVSGSVMTLPNTGLKWEGEEKTIDNPDVTAGLVLPGKTIHLTLHRLNGSYYNHLYSLTNSLIGTVNNGNFEGIGTEKLMFMGAEFDEVISPNGVERKADLQFKERRIPHQASAGWNHFFDPDPSQGKFRRMVRADGNPVFELANFNQFLSIPS